VAQVTINRTEDGKFPKTICGVVHQKTQIAGKIICQFSWSCNPVSKVRYVSDAWQESLLVAQQVLNNNLRMDRLDEALYFHAAHVNPHWGLERVARIGNHIFYSDDKATSKK
jgi:spore germination cell wall hydrolase CwlJ-like protein